MVDLVLEMLEVLQWTLSQTGGKQERCHRNEHDGENARAQSYSGVTRLQGDFLKSFLQKPRSNFKTVA